MALSVQPAAGPGASWTTGTWRPTGRCYRAPAECFCSVRVHRAMPAGLKCPHRAPPEPRGAGQPVPSCHHTSTALGRASTGPALQGMNCGLCTCGGLGGPAGRQGGMAGDSRGLRPPEPVATTTRGSLMEIGCPGAPQRTRSGVSNRHPHTHVHSSVTHSSQVVEATLVSADGWTETYWGPSGQWTVT